MLGEFASVSHPTWVHHLYSCQYKYPTGSMVLSVKELSSWAQTRSYFQTLAKQMGDSETINGLGQAAIKTKNGSIVVRKDWKVLLVNSEGLPRSSGSHPQARMPSRRRSLMSSSAAGTVTEPSQVAARPRCPDVCSGERPAEVE